MTSRPQLTAGCRSAGGLLAGVLVSRRGRKPSWIAWWVTEKAPEITAWLAMIVAAVAKNDQRQPRPFRRHQVERVLDRFGMPSSSAPWPI
jgi:hypothetical protein